MDTVKSAMKYEVKGIDEEEKTVTNIDKKLEKMDQGELDMDDDDDDDDDSLEDYEDNVAEQEIGNLGPVEDLSEVGNEMRKLLKSEILNQDNELSSDDDNLDDSDDPDKEPVVPTMDKFRQSSSFSNRQARESASQNKKFKEKNINHKKLTSATTIIQRTQSASSLLSTNDTTSSNPSDAITEEKIRETLLCRSMTHSELIQKFVAKKQNMTKEQKNEIVQKLVVILKKLILKKKQ